VEGPYVYLESISGGIYLHDQKIKKLPRGIVEGGPIRIYGINFRGEVFTRLKKKLPKGVVEGGPIRIFGINFRGKVFTLSKNKKKLKLPRGVVEGGPIRIFGINFRSTVQQQLTKKRKKNPTVSFRTLPTTSKTYGIWVSGLGLRV
jgi:hypothetical protein